MLQVPCLKLIFQKCHWPKIENLSNMKKQQKKKTLVSLTLPWRIRTEKEKQVNAVHWTLWTVNTVHWTVSKYSSGIRKDQGKFEGFVGSLLFLENVCEVFWGSLWGSFVVNAFYWRSSCRRVLRRVCTFWLTWVVLLRIFLFPKLKR